MSDPGRDLSANLADDTPTSPTVALRDTDQSRIPAIPRPGFRQEANLMLTLGTSYPFLDILWTILIFMAFVIWIWMVVMVMIDIFGRQMRSLLAR